MGTRLVACQHTLRLLRSSHDKILYHGRMCRHDLWPGYEGVFIRRHPHADVGDEAVPEREAAQGLLGLVPHWSAGTRITRANVGHSSDYLTGYPANKLLAIEP